MKILHLENDPRDAELIREQLAASGVQAEIALVQNREAFVASLEKEQFDLVLVDRAMPDFDGLAALEWTRQKQPDLPFIFVSGAMEEEAAIETLKLGATDYVLKHRIGRLASSVVRALREKEEHQQKALLEKKLQEAQKLESLGTLAGGIAHDFNNVLSIIQGYNTFILEGMVKGEEVRESAAIIQKATQRGVALVQQLLKIARTNNSESRPTDIHALLRDLLAMLAHTFPKSIRIELELTGETPVLVVDSGRIHQALLNLCVNARDAMPDDGRLAVATFWVGAEVVQRLQPGARPVRHLGIRLEDTGCGMDDEVRRRVFEPFFTTKPDGRGTGLGLPSVQSAVQHHHGFVLLESAPGKGSVFTIHLPDESAEPAAAPAHDETADHGTLRGGEHILLVEDEPLLRSLMEQVLRDQGYRVTSAADGKEGVDAFECAAEPVDLVLSDLDMPVLDGFRMALEIRRRTPDQPVLLCSGFVEPATRARMLASGISDVLVKPYGMDVLLRTVRQLLGAPAASPG